MVKLLFCCLLTANSIFAMAQQNRFIYIQTENKQAFYVKLDKKIYSSSTSGYVILPQLTDGNYNLQVGFPKNEWPEQSISCTVDKKDAGFMLKNFGDKGWGLFNLQTLEVLMAGAPKTSQEVAVETKKDAFSNMLSNAVNDSTIRQAPPVVQPATPPVAKKEVPPVPVEPVKTVVASTINRLLYVNGKQGAEMIYTDVNGSNADTIRILIPLDKELAMAKPVPQETKPAEPVIKEEVKEPVVIVPAVKEEPPVVKQENPPTKEPVKEVTQPAKEKFINMDLPNPAAKPQEMQPDVVTPTVKKDEEVKETPPAKKVSMINSNCRNHAGEDDFMKLRKKMAAEDNDDDMVAVARKAFKSKCFTTEQIKNLAVLFLKDEGRYKFFDAAYPYVSDTDNFGTLEAQLTDSYYINRFKAMVKH